MRVHVVSDVHGAAGPLPHAAGGADALLCLGDLRLFVDYADRGRAFIEAVNRLGDEREKEVPEG